MSADLHIHSTRIENEPDNPLNVDEWLAAHMGDQIFTVSW